MATLLTLLSEKKRSLISVFLFASFLALLFFSDSLNPFSSSVSAPRKNLRFNSSSPPPVQAQIPSDQPLDGGGAEEGENRDEVFSLEWEICAVGKGLQAADYIPCLDNVKAIKALKSRKRMEHRERHCPSSSPRCLVPFPKGYREPVPWPQSRDMVDTVQQRASSKTGGVQKRSKLGPQIRRLSHLSRWRHSVQRRHFKLHQFHPTDSPIN